MCRKPKSARAGSSLRGSHPGSAVVLSAGWPAATTDEGDPFTGRRYLFVYAAHYSVVCVYLIFKMHFFLLIFTEETPPRRPALALEPAGQPAGGRAGRRTRTSPGRPCPAGRPRTAPCGRGCGFSQFVEMKMRCRGEVSKYRTWLEYRNTTSFLRVIAKSCGICDAWCEGLYAV